MAIVTGGWYDSALFKLKKANFNVSNIAIATADDALSRKEKKPKLMSSGFIFDN